jgi:hypothetical protein
VTGAIFFLFWVWALHNYTRDTSTSHRAERVDLLDEEKARKLKFWGMAALACFAVLLLGLFTIGGLNADGSDNIATVLAKAVNEWCLQPRAVPYDQICRIHGQIAGTIKRDISIFYSCSLIVVTGIFLVYRIARDKNGSATERAVVAATALAAAILAAIWLSAQQLTKLNGDAQILYEWRFPIAVLLAIMMRLVFKPDEEQTQPAT